MTRTFCFLAILAVGACDAAVEGDHRGELLATIEGSLPQAAPNIPRDAEPRVAIGWINKSHMSWFVGGQFPDTNVGLTGFTFDLFSPPADELMEAMPGGRFAMGVVALAPLDDPFTGPYLWTGFDHTHLLVYLEGAPAPESVLYAWLSKPASISAGYHVFDIYKRTEAEDQAWLACANTVLWPEMGMLSTYELILACGPDGYSILSIAPDDLATPFDITSTVGMPSLDVANLMPQL